MLKEILWLWGSKNNTTTFQGPWNVLRQHTHWETESDQILAEGMCRWWRFSCFCFNCFGMFLQCPWFSLKSFLDFWNRNRTSYYTNCFLPYKGGSCKWTLIMDSRCSRIASMAGTGPPPFSMSVSWRNRFPRVWGDPPWEESRILSSLYIDSQDLYTYCM